MNFHKNNITTEIHNKTRAYKGFFAIDTFNLSHEKFDGTKTEPFTREVFERGQAAAILPYDPVTDEVLLIQQFLIGAEAAGLNNRPLQVIAGMIDADQTPEETARREAFEEAGCAPEALIKGPVFMPSPGGTSEVIHTFVSLMDLTGAGGTFGLEVENEDIQAYLVDAKEAINMLDNGEITAGPAVVLLSFFARQRENFLRAPINRS